MVTRIFYTNFPNSKIDKAVSNFKIIDMLKFECYNSDNLFIKI